MCRSRADRKRWCSRERPVPQPGRGEVLIEVAAAGLNRADILQRRGFYPSPPGAPSNPGLEVAGTIVGVGAGVTEFKVGDAVCALLQGGGYAEYCSVDAGQVLPIPGSLDMIEAASLPEAMFTVWSNVFGFGRLQPGETLLVHGGSSGIGVAAIQLAAALGHTVFATAGSDEKCRFCESLGARRAINYKTEDFVGEIAEATGGRGVDVVFDMVGGSYVPRNLQVLATEGRLVMIATQGGAKGEIDVLRIMQQRLVDHGVDAAAALGGVQACDPRSTAAEGVAAARRRPHPSGRRFSVRARRGGQGARTHGKRRAQREDHPRR